MCSLFSPRLERENKQLPCPNCKKKTEHLPRGFEGHNRRWECLVCKKENGRYSEYS